MAMKKLFAVLSIALISLLSFAKTGDTQSNLGKAVRQKSQLRLSG
jgi:hypothetical protein